MPSGAGPFGPPPPNTAPIAANDAYSTTEGTQLDVPGPGVLANDNDADGNSLTAVLVDDASNGGLTFNPDGSFTYSPDAGFTGHDTFTYKANDGTDDSPIATVTITVNAIATPIATCGGFDVFETAPGVFAAPSFPGNLIVGSNGHDWLIGTDGPDLILGLQGPDDIYGKDGDDVICGGAGVDIIEGQQGNDTSMAIPRTTGSLAVPTTTRSMAARGTTWRAMVARIFFTAIRATTT
ncbi:cadherin-like domain-containing protein [Chloroflexi bacterium TSY]|nr:cadherin-like domain-containing protein [Chloroflexi bacterium TSY]